MIDRTANHLPASKRPHTIYHKAATNRDCTILRRLVVGQKSINAQDKTGMTPLHYAVSAPVNGTGALLLLLAKDPDLEIRDNANNRAVDIAHIRAFHSATALLEHRALQTEALSILHILDPSLSFLETKCATLRVPHSIFLDALIDQRTPSNLRDSLPDVGRLQMRIAIQGPDANILATYVSKSLIAAGVKQATVFGNIRPTISKSHKPYWPNNACVDFVLGPHFDPIKLYDCVKQAELSTILPSVNPRTNTFAQDNAHSRDK